jgi:hypothetical protein
VTLQVAHGTPTEVGIWCERCLLPSAVMVPLHFISEIGVSGPLGPILYCYECRK